MSSRCAVPNAAASSKSSCRLTGNASISSSNSTAAQTEGAVLHPHAEGTHPPILQFEITSTGADPIPISIDATLTFNGSANSPVTFSTSGHSAGDTYLIGLQHNIALNRSGFLGPPAKAVQRGLPT